MQIRKALSPAQKATAPTPTTTTTEGENEEDEDDKVLNEMEELTYAMERRKKREKKLLAKKKAKVGYLVLLFSFFLHADTDTNAHICKKISQLKA